MNRQEFLRQLAQLLEDIPEAERREALNYYNDYFDDAGPENEARIIQELGGNPQKAADSLKAEFQSAQTGRRNYGEYSERGYRDNRIPHHWQMPQPMPEKKKQHKNHQDIFRDSRTLKIILIVLILAVTSGIWLGLLGGIIGLLFGLLGTIVGLVIGLASLVIAMLASGIALIASGMAKCIANPALGLLSIGFGMIILAVGILLLLLFLWLITKQFPRIIRWCWQKLLQFFDWSKMKWKNLNI